MSPFSRRSFVASTATIPFALWLDKYAMGQSLVTRYSAQSSQGQTMLAKYSKAVSIMKDPTQKPEGDPLSWIFQWYTHAVRRDRSKSTELQRIYPTADTHRALAQDMWNTCQAHFNPANERFFLPWHRMYVYFLERIVRKLCGDSAFSLPYWNYSVQGRDHGVLPPQFRTPNDVGFAALYVQERNTPAQAGDQTPNVNQGEAIDVYDRGALDLGALSECSYLPNGAASGFNQTLDFGLHGNVHVDVGNRQNMGDVPWAAKDPIFWLHHCNIDRLWASWNRAGRKNPTDSAYLSQQFIFADENGNKVMAKVQDFLEADKLGYGYEDYEAVPSCPVAGLASVNSRKLAAGSASVEVGTGPASVKLVPTQEPGGAATPLHGQLQSLEPTQRIYLVFRDLRAEVQPGVLYRVFLDAPDNSSATARSDHQVGLLNFFAAVGHDLHSDNKDARFLSFDITTLATTLLKQGQLRAEPTVTISPSGRPSAEAKTVIGEVSLFRQ